MKKILLIFMFVIALLSLTSCADFEVTTDVTTIENQKNPGENENKESDLQETFTFFPSTKSILNAEDFKSAFYASKYYNEELEYRNFYNFIPEDISKKYNVNAFEFIDNFDRSYYFLWCNGLIVMANSFPTNPKTESAYIHFAISDLNSDGHFELTSSFSMKGSGSNDLSYQFSYITMVDSSTQQYIKSSTIYNEYVYFKVKDQKDLSVYTGLVKNIDGAINHYTDFTLTTREYEFINKEHYLETDTFNVEITIDENMIHYPFYFKGVDLKFLVTVKMTYLGETFSYLNGDNYLEGARVSFINQDISLNMEGWGAGDVMTHFTVQTGQIIERTYSYLDSLENPSQIGTYDLVISYRGSSIVVTDFLTIS